MRHCEPGPPGVDEGRGAGGSSKLIGRPSLRSWLSSRELIKGFRIIRYQRGLGKEREHTLSGFNFSGLGFFFLSVPRLEKKSTPPLVVRESPEGSP